jgi:flagellar biosynthesis/type III secretory pathway chaperone
MTSDKTLLSILEEQIRSYKIFHDLLIKERECLVKIDPETVEEISKEKDTVIMRLRLLEEERQRLVRIFADENNIDAEVTLKDLGRITGNDRYKTIRSQLLSLLQSIAEINKFNSILIDRSLNYLKMTSNFIGSFTNQDITKTSGVMLSKET